MQAFIPGPSPPLVKTAILLIIAIQAPDKLLADNQLYGVYASNIQYETIASGKPPGPLELSEKAHLFKGEYEACST
jgi:hypothetical protein